LRNVLHTTILHLFHLVTILPELKIITEGNVPWTFLFCKQKNEKNGRQNTLLATAELSRRRAQCTRWGQPRLGILGIL
ncbi:MAG: hypothetical protein J6S73_03145, partial [Lentisphaeria bacterium]|nr:hypothetical protein [Lentisphaeria bacterium]